MLVISETYPSTVEEVSLLSAAFHVYPWPALSDRTEGPLE